LEKANRKREESAWAESSATEDSSLPLVRPHRGGFVEDGLKAQPISRSGKTSPGWESIGEA